MGHKRYAATSLIILLLALSSAYGSGFTFNGIGVKAQGMGGAFRAVADDWSAAYYNPAGYGWIQDNMLSGNVAFFHDRYSVTPEFKWGDQFASGYFNDISIPNKHTINNVPQGGALIRLPVGDAEMVFGFSIIQSFDRNLDWTTIFGFDGTEVYGVRELSTRQFYNNLDVVDAQFTAARTFLEDKLSIGIGIGLRRVDLKFSDFVLRRNTLLDNPTYASYIQRPFERIPEWYEVDGNGYGPSYRIGLMYAPNERTKVGLTFSGKTSITADGSGTSTFYMGDDPSLLSNNTLWTPVTEQYHFFAGENFVNTYDFKTKVDVPAVLGGGISYQFNEKLLLAADFEYVFWSQFKGFEFNQSNYNGIYSSDTTFRSFHYLSDSLMQRGVSYPVKWDNTIKAMAGANYQVNNYTQARVGFAYDQSPASQTTLTPHFVDLGDAYTVSAGLSFDIEVWRVEIAGTYTHQPNLTVAGLDDVNGDGVIDDFPGTYKANTFQTVLGFTYRF